MGFTPELAIFKIIFEEGTPLHGLTIRATPCSIGEWNFMLSQSGLKVATGAERVESNVKIANLFLSHVIEWDLEFPAGHPVPVSEEGWDTLDNTWGEMMITAWQLGMVGIPKISPSKSSSGETSEEATLGLASLSESLPNWVPPS